MATLVSPGVEVTIIDQSQYLPAGSNSVPLVVLATAQNKSNAAGDAVAVGTTKANANKLYQITSQRDLVNYFGSPFFYKTTSGTPIHGYELNEYGLLAAYSILGSSNNCYILRADVDLASLVGRVSRPTGTSVDGTHWLDITTSTWGINVWNAATQQFVQKTPIVIESTADIEDIVTQAPKQSIGNIGDYAITMTKDYGDPGSYRTIWYKAGEYLPTSNANYNKWVGFGTDDFYKSVPILQGGSAASTITTNNIVQIGEATTVDTTAGTASVSPAMYSSVLLKSGVSIGTLSVAGLVSAINGAKIRGITALEVNGKINIFSVPDGSNYNVGTASTLMDPTLSSYGSTLWIKGDLSQYGISGTTNGKLFYPVTIAYVTNAQQPDWRADSSTPRPSGSVWVKTNAANNGTNLIMSKFSSASGNYTTINCPVFVREREAIAALDAAGGKNISAGALYASYSLSALQIYRRKSSGPAVYTCIPTAASFIYTASRAFLVEVTLPGTSNRSSRYTITLPSGVAVNAEDFSQAWTNERIPYTTCKVNASGNIEITHTEGGSINFHRDYDILDSTTGGLDSSKTYDSSQDPLVDFGIVSNQDARLVAVETYLLSPGNLPSTVNWTAAANSSVYLARADNPAQKVGISSVVINGRNIPTVAVVNTGSLVTTAAVTYAVGDVLTLEGLDSYFDEKLQVIVTSVTGTDITTDNYALLPYSGKAKTIYDYMLTKWGSFDYEANDVTPTTLPANNTNWYYSSIDQVDIMVNSGSAWVGYRNATYDSNGVYQKTQSGSTDPVGVQVSSSAPTAHSDGTALVYGDLWLDSSDLENYPKLYRWASVNNLDQWVLIDNTDQVTERGIVFADARWAGNNGVDPHDDAIPTTVSMLTSNYTDLDCPSPSLYPRGTLLFNTRRSGYNVKQFRTNYFTKSNYPNASTYTSASTALGNLPKASYTWVSVSGNKTDGSPYMGRKAQRVVVTSAMNAAINTNQAIREEDTFFNLIAAPGYPEVQSALITLNNDRSQTAYIVGDTPMRLKDDANDITAWATNSKGATSTGEDGLVTRNTYLGLYYPSGITTDLTGSQVVVPASHMILRTMLYNDTVAYPWMAPAGQLRGIVDNVTNIGYIDASTGEFKTTKNRNALRDIQYQNFVNPISYFTNVGILNYGNKNSLDSQSSLDRTNVARLICYIRERLQVAVRPFIFEPNDTITRSEAKSVVQTLMADILSKRGIFDYSVVCDESNNTPARIDRNELYIDIAIEPAKAVEFIYIPVRILNTGEIGG